MSGITNETFLPTYEQLTVPELKLSTPALKAGCHHLGVYCESKMKEYMLCRNETEDPRKCLKEGADLTGCGIEFFQKVKKMCRPEFEALTYCVDHASAELDLRYCRIPQRPYDECMLNKLGLRRPEVGYFARVHVHQTERAKPEPKAHRKYKEEAAKVIQECPEDVDLSKREWRRYIGHHGNLDYGFHT